jgi:hypothetical protein
VTPRKVKSPWAGGTKPHSNTYRADVCAVLAKILNDQHLAILLNALGQLAPQLSVRGRRRVGHIGAVHTTDDDARGNGQAGTEVAAFDRDVRATDARAVDGAVSWKTKTDEDR